MRFRVTMKCPDALDRAIEEAIEESDLRLFTEARRREIQEETRIKAGRWFKYGEILTVEIDTETEACLVVEANQA